MKKFLIAGLLALMSVFSFADGIVKNEAGDYIIFRDDPTCPADIAEMVAPEVRTMLHPAEAMIDGVKYRACYVDGGNAYYVLYEDGDQSAIPKEMVQEYHGV